MVNNSISFAESILMVMKSNIPNKHTKPVSGNIFLLISPKGATILILGLASLNRLSKLNTVEVIRSLDLTSFYRSFKDLICKN